ncbi:MAG: tRNA (adenosine(37)-N6)-threonylcarbamoyltransferase complex transferase subunit TsaD [Desulfocapsaceae bacterium]|nr:tRNA (adenosine(37)-N6)-threonylcarbamoyltransferase complex transferase subunit TsaD [Desulfocapsaceae bacterium]
MPMLTLGIESSCDDTSAAVLLDDKRLLSSIVSGQDTIHAKYGGVVPELASRKHLEAIHPIVDEALSLAGVTLNDIDLIAVTQGPGLIGSLLVGFSYAKSLSYVTNIPYIGVDHMAGHLLAIYLEEQTPSFPYISLIVSGGTTSLFICHDFTHYQLIGRTRDDAAGEAFDKVAKILELGYPGGPAISEIAKNGNQEAFSFPRSWLEPQSLDFSFSGLKTSVLNTFQQFKSRDAVPAADISASFQKAVVDVLVTKTLLAAEQFSIKTIVLGGGVSANVTLRETMKESCLRIGAELHYPQPKFCTDNAAMIAMAGYHKFRHHSTAAAYDDDVYSRSTLG